MVDFLLQSDLKPSVAAIADRFREKIFFFLQRHVDNAPLGRIENAKCERAAIFSNLFGSKSSHGVKLSLSGLQQNKLEKMATRSHLEFSIRPSDA